ncbi:hypothetical protein TD95_001894 [Thielaviopsis punctulata]|uniref:non-specific serine/threonine protein kinase n=1 Tax=Thielaviopsis punctulata TaxID=72032 RepID=A0A0F4ZK48_9PEZI|nr:hypothetical protein TD95_001894 [Thielaviopsis punctulata]
MTADGHHIQTPQQKQQQPQSHQQQQQQPQPQKQSNSSSQNDRSDDQRGRLSLTHSSPLQKNRSTGNLLSIISNASSADPPADRSRSRYSLDVSSELEAGTRSNILIEHDHLGLSSLRRIRQQQQPFRSHAHPSAPSSRSPSVAGLRSSSMHISLPSPSMMSTAAAGPTSPLFIEDLSRFPSESLHSFSFAQTDESRQTAHRSHRWMPTDDSDTAGIHASASMADLRDAPSTCFFDRGFGPRTASPERLTPTEVAPTLTSQTIPEDDEVYVQSLDKPVSPLLTKATPKALDLKARPGTLKRTMTETSPSAVPEKVIAAEYNFGGVVAGAKAEATLHDNPSPVVAGFPARSMSGTHGLGARWVPAAQAIFTTEAKPPWTILSANDLACLLFGVTKTEIRKIGILEVVQEERRAWLEKKLRYLDPAGAEKDEPSRPNASAAAAAASALIGSQAGMSPRFLGSSNPRSPVSAKPSRRAQTVHNGDPNPPKTRTASHHRSSQSRGVLLCGDVVPIQKRNGTTGSASIWVKEKRVGLIWVVEEIHEDSALITLSPDGTVERVTGACQVIWGKEKIKSDIDANILIPRIPRQGIDPREGPIDYAQIARRRFYTCPFSAKVNIPCSVEQVRGSLELRVSSFPHMAGIIVLTPDKLTIKSTNSVFCGSLFGWERADGKAITSIITNFDKLLKILQEEDGVDLTPGMVIPETSFRKAAALLALREHQPDASDAFLYPIGISAKHRDGSELKVDVQMRVIQSDNQPGDIRGSSVAEVDEDDHNAMQAAAESQHQIETVYALWVTYSRHLHCSQSVHEQGTPPLAATMSPLHQPSPGQVESRSPVDMHSDSDDAKEPKEVKTPVKKKISGSVTPFSLDEKTKSPPQTPTALKPAAAVHKTPKVSSTPKIAEQNKTPVSTATPTSPATTPSAPQHKPGTRAKATIDDYTILEEMGQGAYGQVKLARHNATGRKVVLKYVTKRRILVDTWTRDRRLGTVPLEIHVMSYLRRPEYMHPNIVEMECFFEDNVNYYIEMVPHGMPGMDLFDYIELRANDMAEAECRSIFLQVARAVDHLHNVAKVVHRDIKDENVILDGKGVIKLIDFGSAAYIKSGPFNVFVGTIDYAAPEVLAGKSYNGKEQDVWALGILLYTIIYKENPFYTIDEIIDHDLRVPYIISEDSIDLVRRMLDRNVEERYTIDQVLQHPWIKLAMEEEKAAKQSAEAA